MDNILSNNHELKVLDRGLIYLTGIEKIISFDNEEFLMKSNMGLIILKGADLEVVKLDTHDGTVSIKGTMNSIAYDDEKKKDNESFLGKLFK